jgi:hypothetical protein
MSENDSSSRPPAAYATADPAPLQQPYDPDEINLLEYVYALLRHKWLIVGVAFCGLVAGYIAAKVKGPSYKASVLISPKESESKKAPSISGLGGFGGMVASQLDMGGNASLEKVETIVETRKFNAQLLEKAGLVPMLYKEVNPEYYKEYYDTTRKAWIADSLEPQPRKIAGAITGELLNKKINDNNTMTMEIESSDSAFSDTLLSSMVSYLNVYLKNMIESEANENIAYLEDKLRGIADPLLREKIQGMIASEYEKAMVVSKEAFTVLDPVFVSTSFREKKLYPLVFGFGFFFMAVLVVVFVHAFGSSDKTPEDQKLIQGIRKELFRLPFRKV